MRITTILQIASAICGWAAMSPAIARSNKFQTLYSFGSVPGDGAYPFSPLIANKALLYGTTDAGGPEDYGTVYAIDPVSGIESIMAKYPGEKPNLPVTYYKRNLYGSSSIGNIFRIDIKTKALTNLYRFPYNNDDEPAGIGNLVAVGEKLFGTVLQADGSQLDDPQFGSLFEYDLATGTVTILYNFTGGADGAYPQGLILHLGLLYGVTTNGGDSGAGAVFTLDPVSGAEKTIYSFNGTTDGAGPSGITFHDGIVYGTAAFGGVDDNGTLFSFDPVTRKYTTLFMFPGGAGGCSPSSPPAIYNSKLYGTGYCGNSNNDGVLYKLSLKTGEEKILHTFTNGADGGSPMSGLLLYQGGLYGTTTYGGTYGEGTVFRFTP